jgi:hypothetical protein
MHAQLRKHRQAFRDSRVRCKHKRGASTTTGDLTTEVQDTSPGFEVVHSPDESPSTRALVTWVSLSIASSVQSSMCGEAAEGRSFTP